MHFVLTSQRHSKHSFGTYLVSLNLTAHGGKMAEGLSFEEGIKLSVSLSIESETVVETTEPTVGKGDSLVNDSVITKLFLSFVNGVRVVGGFVITVLGGEVGLRLLLGLAGGRVIDGRVIGGRVTGGRVTG
jgi:hypothetical protein